MTVANNTDLELLTWQNDQHLGGACGEITTMINKGVKLINPLGM